MSLSENCTNSSMNILLRHNDQLMRIYEKFTSIYIMEYVFMPVWLLTGIPGAIISFHIWSIRRQHHSSALYLCILAIDDLLFFVFNSLFYLNNYQSIRTIENQYMCRFFPFFSIVLQYAAPMLTLGFTMERCISICYPFISNRISNYRATVKTCSFLIFFCVIVATPKLYFYSYEVTSTGVDGSVSKGSCQVIYQLTTMTDKDLIQRLETIMYNYEMITEILMFAIVPFMIFFVNIRVIFELLSMAKRRSVSTNTLLTYSNRPANTTTLLIISFYLLCATIPASVCQLLKFSVNPIQTCILDEDVPFSPQWKRHLRNVYIQILVDMLAKTYYAAKFYIYIITSQWFRTQLMDLFKKRHQRISTVSRMSCSQHMPGRTSLTFQLLKKQMTLKPNDLKQPQ